MGSASLRQPSRVVWRSPMAERTCGWAGYCCLWYPFRFWMLSAASTPHLHLHAHHHAHTHTALAPAPTRLYRTCTAPAPHPRSTCSPRYAHWAARLVRRALRGMPSAGAARDSSHRARVIDAARRISGLHGEGTPLVRVALIPNLTRTARSGSEGRRSVELGSSTPAPGEPPRCALVRGREARRNRAPT